jgi:hypothetical protein
VSGDLLVAASKPQVQRDQLFAHLEQHAVHRIRQSDVVDQCGQRAKKAVC